MKNILQYLEAAEKRFPEKTAFADESESVSFTALAELSRRGGSRLISKGLYNEPVAVFMKKAPQVICAFFAVIYAGCYYVPLDPGMPKHRIRMILDRLQPSAVVCDDACFSLYFQYLHK